MIPKQEALSLGAIRGVAARALPSGTLYTLVSLGVVQGLSIMIQLLLARWLSAEHFGTMRVLDTWLGLLAVPAGLGMASVVVKFVAEGKSEVDQGQRLTLCLSFSAIASLLVAALIWASLPFLGLSEPVRYYLTALVWAVLAINLSRTAINYFQGLKQMRQVALYNVIFCLVGLVLVLVPTWYGGLEGWVAGRIVFEFLFAVATVWLVRRALTFAWDSALAVDILRNGFFSAVALALDKTAMGIDLLLLGWLLGSSKEVGHFGLGLLLLTASLLVPGAISQVLLPHFAERSADPAGALAYGRPYLEKSMALVAVMTVLLMAATPVLTVILGNEYNGAMVSICVTFLAIPVLAVANYYGTFLLAIGKVHTTIYSNAFGIGVSIVTLSLLWKQLGPLGAALSFLLASIVRTIYLWSLVKKHASNSPR